MLSFTSRLYFQQSIRVPRRKETEWFSVLAHPLLTVFNDRYPQDLEGVLVCPRKQTLATAAKEISDGGSLVPPF